MITPPFLSQGDKIGIVSTARKIAVSEVEPAMEIIKKWGFVPVYGKNLFKEHHQFAGTDNERRSDFQQMLDNPDVKAILCARGGYGTLRILTDLDFSSFIKNPKWIIGYSDITVLHSFVNRNFGIETIHGTMPLSFPSVSRESIDSLKEVLTGMIPEYQLVSHLLNRTGQSTGILTGGNLSIIYSLRGTPGDIDTSGKILFLEDLDEYLYHIDRMMMNLKFGNKLEPLAGLMVGGMTEMRDNTVPFGRSAEEIIAEAVSNYSFPVAFNVPAGHSCENRAMILGRMVSITVSGNSSVIKFHPPTR